MNKKYIRGFDVIPNHLKIQLNIRGEQKKWRRKKKKYPVNIYLIYKMLENIRSFFFVSATTTTTKKEEKYLHLL